MRFAKYPAAALALLLPLVSQVASSSLTQRDLVDVCANVDAELQVDVLGIKVDIGLIQVCLCLSVLPTFIETNLIAIAAVDLVGQASVLSALTGMVNDAADHKSCSYPDHSSPFCEAGNPCGFTCSDGFTPFPAKNPTSCVCESPQTVCNGVCGDFKGCASSGPKKRDTQIRKRAVCEDGLTPCGVFGWQGQRSSQAWECVDTTSDLESCGGCAIPLHYASPHGIDCTALPGVADVSCNFGSCMVHRCLPGYQVSLDGTFCLRTRHVTQVNVEEDAAAYGLEHVPLKV
ncbi:hypothetical protein CERSUDRAFT_87858 [Gelatoporia subvermispora B]|uniref:Protein CPL1-like domain-containing protein n=1 Tax=Ceriporiopsis subvermispora (strain B) TaxID=914234 RepID=M2QK86_CERS8|nr:hypothetical protein CERSUDRAFT_87858 [Gelatoporia subvermispora B]